MNSVDRKDPGSVRKAILLGAAHSIAYKMARGVEQSQSLALAGVYEEAPEFRNFRNF